VTKLLSLVSKVPGQEYVGRDIGEPEHSAQSLNFIEEKTTWLNLNYLNYILLAQNYFKMQKVF